MIETVQVVGASGRVGSAMTARLTERGVALREDGAELFLVPADNCDDAVESPHGDMRLTRVATMSEAVDAIEDWAADPDADLPQCTTATGDAGE